MSLRQALKWSLFGELSARVVQPAAFLLLARLLAPEDYGVMAASALVVSLAMALADAGLGRALVQHQGDRRSAASAVFWTQAAIGLVAMLAIMAGAGPLARLVFDDARVADVLRVMALQVPLAALGGAPAALLQKDMRFKRLFRVRLVGTLVPAALSIPLALNGAGYWALVAGAVAGQAVQLAALWQGSGWQPDRRMAPESLRSLWRFGGWASLGSMLMWLHAWGDVAIVGHVMGTRELGIYRTGNLIVDMLFATLIGSVTPVLFGYFSGLQHDRERIRAVLTQVQTLLLAFALPVGLALFLFQAEAAALLGPRWQGIGLVIGIMGLAHALSWTMGANDEACKAIGRPDVFPKVLALSLMCQLPAYWLAAPYGLEVFLWVRCVMFVTMQGWDLWVMHRVLGMSVVPMVRRWRPVLYSALLYVSLHLVVTHALARFDVPGASLIRLVGYCGLVLGCYGFLFRRDAFTPWVARRPGT